MNRSGAVFGRVTRFVRWAIFVGLPLAGFAQTNSWNSPASGHWEDSTWSLGIPPAADQSVLITNAGSKAVGIFSTTAANFPGTMTVDSLAISAPSNSRNTLLLNYVGTAVPLQVLNYCAIGNNGRLLNLSSSLRMGGSFSITTNGSFIQQGGMTIATNWFLAVDGGTAAVTNGVFLFSQMEISDGGSFTQSGGSVNGNIEVEYDGTYNLIDGFLLLGDLSIDGFSTNAGIFNQSGGTNVVSYLSSSGAYHLTGGFLSTSNAFIFSGSVHFEQSGGVHLAGGTLSCKDYTLTGGTLVASNLQVSGTLAIGPSPAVSISNTISFALQGGGTLQLSNSMVSLAPLGVSGNGTIQFFGNDKLTFADSSTQSWSGSLTVSNWNGSTSGGGAEQLIFGKGKSGLTLRQLERIAFIDPAGFPPGSWRATILPTGEVVPTTSPTGPTQPNLWTSPASGHWEDSTWSLGVPPASDQTVLITNAGLKAVGISPSTPVNFPGTMTVGDLVVSAPGGGSNTLLLNFSGTNVPLRVINDCTVGTNGGLENFYSGLQIGGDLVVSNGAFVQEGGVTWVTNGTFISNGGVMMTNATLWFSNVDLVTNAVMVQSGGMLNGAGLTIYAGTFTQFAGTNRSDMNVGGDRNNGGDYLLYGGRIECAELDVDSGNFSQYGGMVLNTNLWVGGQYGVYGYPGLYSLYGGVLITGNFSTGNGSFSQSGGEHIVNGVIYIAGVFNDYGPPPLHGSYTLNGGFLTSSGINLQVEGAFFQGGGTNRILGDLGVNETYFWLTGGTLSESNLSLGRGGGNILPQTYFLQTSGTNQVANVFTCGGIYQLDGGTLIAPKIIFQDNHNYGYDDSSLLIGPSPGASVSNALSIELDGGKISFNNSTQRLGGLILAGYASINLQGSCTLRFADSSAAAWTNGSLTIMGWNGSLSGGGTDQVFFGNSADGLTPGQLQRIQFVNVQGFPSDSVFAKILPTGEVVPTTQPSLTTSVSGTNLLVQWPVFDGFVLQAATNAAGPFEDISNALDPFTNDTTLFPQRFFRLRRP